MQHTWIFQLEKPFTAAQQPALAQGLNEFLQRWKAHGHPVKGAAELRHQRFFILQAEEGTTSGCSIDSMTREMEQILSAQGLALLEPAFILYRQADGGMGQVHFRDVRTAIASGQLTADTVVYDTSMGQSSDLARFEVPLSQSWLGRHLPVSQ